MNATAAVAVIGAIATPTVAIVGYVITDRRGRDERRAARLLARDAQEHESKMRNADRLYEDRKAAYLMSMRFLLNVASAFRAIQGAVEGHEPAGTADVLPFADADAEAWERMRVEVAMFGSQRVDEGMRAFSAAAVRADSAITAWRVAGDAASITQLDEAVNDVLNAGNEVRAAMNADLA